MTSAAHRAAVSFDDEPLILVDDQDREVGFEQKAKCHEGEGLLHRAFSVFLFNSHGELLLQQRSSQKKLWPLFWSNSCCSHPRRGESLDQATQRRVQEELGVTAKPVFLFRFVYQSTFENVGSEFESCSVFVCQTDDPIATHPDEISAVRFLGVPAFEQEMRVSPGLFTPWLKIEWPRLRSEHWDTVLSLQSNKKR